MVDLPGEHLGDEAPAIGEPSEQRRGTDSGPPGDRVHRYVESALGEQLLRRGEDPPTIRSGIRTHTGRAGGVDLSRLGHVFSHFPRKRNGYSTYPLSLSGKPAPEQAGRRADRLSADGRGEGEAVENSHVRSRRHRDTVRVGTGAGRTRRRLLRPTGTNGHLRPLRRSRHPRRASAWEETPDQPPVAADHARRPRLEP